MAQIGGDDDNTNVELNLVPFIDLMCVCITFLLITAVWTQVSMIQLGTSIYGKKDPNQSVPIEPKGETPIRLDVKPYGYVINIEGSALRINKLGEEFDNKTLLRELQKMKAAYPNKEDAVVSVADELPYDALVQGMDQLIGAGFTNIGIATGEVL